MTLTFSMRRLVDIGFEINGGVKSKETRSDQNGKCNSPIFSTQTTYMYALQMCYVYVSSKLSRVGRTH